MINILFVYGLPFVPTGGGIQRATEILCRALIEKGYHCEYLTFLPKRNSASGAAYKFPCPSSFINYDIDSIEAKQFYHRFLDAHNIDIIINQDGFYEYSHFFLDIGSRSIKRISVLHGDPDADYHHVWHMLSTPRNDSWFERLKCLVRPLFYFKLKGIFLRALLKQLRFLDENNDAIVALSPCYIAAVTEHYPPIRSKCIAIANPNTYGALDRLPDKQPYECLYVGRFDNKSKNLLTLLDIWKIVSSKKKEAHLSLVGWGESENIIREYAQHKKLKNITFYPRQNPENFYKKASFFCMTSVYEGFPLALTESMSFGCVPIVFSSFPAVFDIIKGQHKECCIIRPFDKKAYARQLLRIMDDESLRIEIGKQSLADVRKFDVPVIVSQWTELIKACSRQ